MGNLAQVIASIFLFLVAWCSAWVAIAWPLFKKYDWRPFQPTAPEQKLILLLPLYLLAPLSIWGANWALDQSWQSIGVLLDPAGARSLGLGFGIAAAGLFLLLFFKKSVRLISWNFRPLVDATPQKMGQRLLAIAGLLLLAVLIGGIEELVFRGWLQTQLEMAFSPWLAATIGSFLFAIAHLIWDGRAGLWQQPGLFLLGWVLVIARWADGGSIALAWGLHAGWVWGLACIGEFLQPQPIAGKPRWLTGRPAQPLTDALDIALMVLTAGLIWQIFHSGIFNPLLSVSAY